MTTNLKTFSFAPGLDLRSIDIDGSPWFVASDVFSALTLSGFASNHMKPLDDDEKQILSKSRISDPSLRAVFGSRANSLAIVNESGLYSLILRSRKVEALAFKKWVTSVVLPSIRKTGGYMTPEVAVLAVEDPAVFMARALVIARLSPER